MKPKKALSGFSGWLILTMLVACVDGSDRTNVGSADTERCNELFSFSEEDLGLSGYDTEAAVVGLRNFALAIGRTVGPADDEFLGQAADNVIALTRDAADKWQQSGGLGNNQLAELSDGWLVVETRCNDLIQGRESNLALPPRSLSEEVDVRFVPPYEIRVGDCLLDEQDRLDFGASMGTSRTVAITDCANRHDSEFFAGTAFEPGGFPGDEAVSDFAIDFCLTGFDSFVGVIFEESTLNAFYLSPSAQEWELGNRTVLCGIYDPEGPVEGSLKGAKR
jgi:hypothetical protein